MFRLILPLRFRASWFGFLFAAIALGPSGVPADPGDVLLEMSYPAPVHGAGALMIDGGICVRYGSGIARIDPVDGTIEWSFAPSENGVSHGPAVSAAGTVYFVSDRQLHAVSADGEPLWSTPSDPDRSTALLIGHDGAIYISSEKWRFSQTLEITTSSGELRFCGAGFPSIPGAVLGMDGSGWAISRAGWLRPDTTLATGFPGTSAEPLAVNPDGSLFAVTNHRELRRWARDGSLLMEATLDLAVDVPRLAVREGRVVATGNPDWVEVIGDDGASIWQVQFDPVHGISAPTVTAGGHVYVTIGDTAVIALDLETGAETWRVSRTGLGDFHSPLVDAAGRVVVGRGTAGLLIIEGDGSVPPAEWWAMSGANVRRSLSLASTAQLTPPSAPMAFAASTTWADRIELTWTPDDTATHYEVYRSNNEGFSDAALLPPVGFILPGYPDRAAVPGESYYYWVRGMNRAGAGEFSGPVSGIRPVQDDEREVVLEIATGPRTLFGEVDAAPVILPDGTFFLALRSGDFLRVSDRLELTRLPGRFDPQTSMPVASAALTDSGDFAVVFATPGAFRHVGSEVVFLRADGTESARPTFDGRILSPLAVTDAGTLVLAHVDGFRTDQAIVRICHVGRDGVIWSLPVRPSDVRSLGIDSDGTIIAGHVDGGITWIGPEGQLLAETIGPIFPDRIHFLADHSVLVANGGGTLRRWNSDGTKSWNLEVGDSTVWIRETGTIGAATKASMEWIEIQPQSGEMNRRVLATGGWIGEYEWNDSTGWLQILNRGVPHLLDLSETILESGPDTEACRIQFLWPLPNGHVLTLCQDEVYRVFPIALTPRMASPPVDLLNRNRGDAPFHLPEPPDRVEVDAAESQRYLAVTWPSVPNARTYEVWRAESDQWDAAVRIANDFFGSTRYLDRGALPGQSYWYWIKASNVAGTSPVSPPGTAVRQEYSRGVLLESWSIPDVPLAGISVGDDDHVFLPVRDRGFLALAPDGEIAWSHETSKCFEPAVVASDGTAYFEDEFGMVRAIATGGTLLWEHGTAAPNPVAALARSLALDAEGRLVIADGFAFWILNPDGSVVTRRLLPQYIAVGPVIGPGGGLHFIDANGVLSVFESDGSERWTSSDRPLPRSDRGRFSISSDGTAFYHDQNERVFYLRPDGYFAGEIFPPDRNLGVPLLDAGGTVVSPRFRSVAFLDPALPNEPIASLDFGRFIWSPTLLENGVILAPGQDGVLAAYARDGELQWEIDLGAPLVCAPVVAASGIAYCCGSGRLSLVYTGPIDANAPWPMEDHDPRRTTRQSMPVDSSPVEPPILSTTPDASLEGITVAWSSVPGIKFYELFKSRSVDGSDSVRVDSGKRPLWTVTDLEVAPGRDYFYYVEGITLDETRVRSETVRGRRLDPQPGDAVRSLSLDMDQRDTVLLAADIQGNLIAAVDRKSFGFRVSADWNMVTRLEFPEAARGSPVAGEQGGYILLSNGSDRGNPGVYEIRSSGDVVLFSSLPPGTDSGQIAVLESGSLLVASGGPDGGIIRELDSDGTVSRELHLPDGPPSLLVPVHPGRFLFQVAPEFDLAFWDWDEGSLWGLEQNNVHRRDQLIPWPSGELVTTFSGGFDSALGIWDIASGHLLRTIACGRSASDPFARDAGGLLWAYRKTPIGAGEIVVGTVEGSLLHRIPLDTAPSCQPVADRDGAVIWGFADGSVRSYSGEFGLQWVARSNDGPVDELLLLAQDRLVVRRGRQLTRLIARGVTRDTWQNPNGDVGNTRRPFLVLSIDVRAEAHADGTYRIGLVVADATGNHGIERVKVFLDEIEVGSGASDGFTVDSIPTGRHRLRLETVLEESEELILARRLIDLPDVQFPVTRERDDLVVHTFGLAWWDWSFDLNSWYPGAPVSSINHRLRGWAITRPKAFFRFQVRAETVETVRW